MCGLPGRHPPCRLRMYNRESMVATNTLSAVNTSWAQSIPVREDRRSEP
jgi:hypothetical protein